MAFDALVRDADTACCRAEQCLKEAHIAYEAAAVHRASDAAEARYRAAMKEAQSLLARASECYEQALVMQESPEVQVRMRDVILKRMTIAMIVRLWRGEE